MPISRRYSKYGHAAKKPLEYSMAVRSLGVSSLVRTMENAGRTVLGRPLPAVDSIEKGWHDLESDIDEDEYVDGLFR